MKSLRIYLTGHCRELANVLAGTLTKAGHTVVSTWHQGEPKPLPKDRGELLAGLKRGMATITEGSDAVVVIVTPEHVERMRVEVSESLSRVKVFTVGGVESGVTWENGIRHAKDVGELLGMLGEGEPLPGEAAA